MPNTGHVWSTAEVDLLRRDFARKPYSQQQFFFAREWGKKHGLSIYAVDSKIKHLKAEGLIDISFPRVLLFDIETLPLEVYTWQLHHNDYIPHENIIKDWSLSCWSAKWLLEPEMYGAVVTGREAKRRDDERILKPLWKLINQADVVIGQNSNKFDIKKINTRFLFYGMGDTMPYVSIDTLSASRSKFGFTSFKLDYMNKYLGLNGKNHVDMNDFRACAQGDDSALQKMYEYNQKDVLILEEFYMRVRPYIKHPNFAAWSGKVVELAEDEYKCPVCSGIVTENKMTGTWRSPAGHTYSAFRCPHCGAIGRKTERSGGRSIRTKKA